MSKVDDLISALCPKGVTSKAISSICNVSRGRVMSKDYLRDNAGEYPVYSSQTANNGVFGKIQTYDYDGEYLTWTTDGANAGSIFYRTGKFSITNVCGLLKVSTHSVNAKYLSYILGTLAKKYVSSGMGNPKLMSNVMSAIKVPIPPLEVQEEIVNILDKFTRLEAELSAELSARQKQYEFYRNQLLTFDDEGGVQWTTLGEVAMYSKSRIASDELDHENYVGVDNLLQNRQGKTDSSHAPNSGNMTRFDDGDILIGNIRPYLKKIWHADRVGGTNGDVLVVQLQDKYKDKLIPRYLYQLLASDNFFTFNMRNSKGAKMPRGDKTSILKFDIPVPSIEAQRRAISILDKFDTLVSDISIGLPAEITARRQQYEYYRTRLLTFQELTV
ncbi:MAG: restriction endonuclease subunit S [Candidatus Saccharimonas sp.]